MRVVFDQNFGLQFIVHSLILVTENKKIRKQKMNPKFVDNGLHTTFKQYLVLPRLDPKVGDWTGAAGWTASGNWLWTGTLS